MAEGGRYRRIFVRLWRNEAFAGMDDAHKVVTLYLLAGPQTNRIGFYRLSFGAAADDLGTLPEPFAIRFRTVCETVSWRYDSSSRMLLIPTWWRYNPPANPKMLKGLLTDLDELPKSSLFSEFCATADHLPEPLREVFRDGCRYRIGNGITSGTGTGTGTGIKNARAKKARVGSPTWLTPFAEVWKEHVGTFAFGKASTFLQPVVSAIGEQEAVRRFKRYCTEAQDKTRLSFARFAETYKALANGNGQHDPYAGWLHRWDCRTCGGVHETHDNVEPECPNKAAEAVAR